MRLFDTAIFCDPLDRRIYEYKVDNRCSYLCRNGHWTVTQHALPPRANAKLGDILKTIDAQLREATGYGHPIKSDLQTKWMLKIISEEISGFLEEKKAAEKKRLKLDFSQLDRIRSDAAVTQEKLIVDEESEEDVFSEEASCDTLLPLFPGEELEVSEPQEEAAAPNTDCPFGAAEYRLLQSLLYGRNLDWIQTEGHMLSVLLDSINDKLYDVFLDTVVEEGPSLVEDYIAELKEMIKP